MFEDHFRTNVFGAFYVTKAALAHLKPGASVIFTSSVNSKHPMPSLLAYSATKGALSNLVLSLAQLLAEKGIRVNGISAGPIKTLAASGIGNFGKLLAHNAKVAPLRRNVTTDEVGNVAAFLLSDLASGMTGEITYVDSGFNITALGAEEV